MRGFLAGLVVGGAVAFLLVAMLGGGDPAPAPERPADESPEMPVRRAEGQEPSESAMQPGIPDRGDAPTGFAPGTAVLRVGDGYVFGDDRATSGGAEVDLLCQDIHHGVSLRCPHGTVPVDLPLGGTGLPTDPAEVAALVPDAPSNLPGRDANLTSRSRPEAPGVALVRSRSGRTYKVWLVREDPHPEALRRRAHIGYAEVPAREGGGVVRIPTESSAGEEVPTQKDVADVVKVGSSVPGTTFATFLQGRYVKLSELPGSLVLNERKFLLVEDPLLTEVTFKRRGGMYASAGIAEGGRVVLDSYSGVAVRGDMAGTVDVKSYGYVHISGDLTGVVNVESYAMVVIDGDILGTLKVRSYTSLLLRGRVFGKLDALGSCWSTFYFESYIGRSDLERMEGAYGSVTLHVRESDLTVGKHEKIGTWRSVIVGDEVWKKLAR